MQVAVLLVCFFIYCEAFDCGIHVNNNDKLKNIITNCLNNNKTLEDLWDMTSMSSESSSSSEEPELDDKMSQSFRSRRSAVHEPEEKAVEQSQENSQNSSEIVGDSCIVQCVFQQMEMTDADGFPEHEKILHGLLKTASGREFRDFLQDMTNECFQEVKKDVSVDSCVFSTKILSCLADKGKTNCADWPVGNLPFTN